MKQLSNQQRYRLYEYLGLGLVLSVYSFGLLNHFEYLRGLKYVVYFANDAQEYRDVGFWLSGNATTEATLTRPFFYPLFLAGCQSAGGYLVVWFFQMLFWISSGLLLYYSIRKISRSYIWAIAGTIIFASNISLLLLTLHALTEVIVVLLLCISIAVILNREKYSSSAFWTLLLFLFALLTVTKPVFQLVLLPLMFYAGIRFLTLFYRNKVRLKPKTVLLMLLALSPLIAQVSIMKAKHDSLSISHIGGITLRKYYVARIHAEINHQPLVQSIESVKSLNKGEAITYILCHPGTSIRVYLKNLGENLLAGSNFVEIPLPHPDLSRYMQYLNRSYFAIHLLMLFPLSLVFYKTIREKHWIILETRLLLLYPLAVIILTSGLSFFQGDRLVLPSLPLWITLYCAVLIDLTNKSIPGEPVKLTE